MIGGAPVRLGSSVQVTGTVAVILLGTLWHFVFELAGRWWPLAFFFPVNESVWEHLKMAFWPAILFGVFQWRRLPGHTRNLVVATVLSALLGPLLIVMASYGYTSILGRHYLVLDILNFMVAVALAQWVSYRVLTSPMDLRRYSGLAVVAIGLALMAFLSLSFSPPRWELFLDRPSGSYGIPPR